MADPTDAGEAASLLMVGFEGLTVGSELREFVAQGAPAGVILFGHNIESAAQVARLTSEVRGLWPTGEGALPPLIAVDQEGGRVRRLKGPATPQISPWPPMRHVGDTGSRAVAEEIGEVMGTQLAALGFNLNFAPVLDVDSNPANPVIGGRAFGTAAEVVGPMGIALATGLQRAGVLACGKHFPGHGDTDVDSHLTLPRLVHSRDRLASVELRPFRDAIEAGVLHCMMTAHIVFEALDAEHPATLSEHVIPQLLRDELGYEGVVVSDDLEMAAIADHYDADEIARRGLAADLDLFLVCHSLERARHLRDALRRAEPQRVKTSRRRLKALRRRAVDHAARGWDGVMPGQDRGRELAARFGWSAQG